MDNLPVYYKSSAHSLYFHCWGEQCAVYHFESGDTHVVNKIDLEVLQQINEKPISAASLLVRLEYAFDAEVGHYIAELLANCATLGLIETADNEPAN